MGARARGRVAAESPLALQPVPRSPPAYRRELCSFVTGFFTAVALFFYWILQSVHVVQFGEVDSV